MVLTGGVGLLAGLFGSKKIVITCLSCGRKFAPGEGDMSTSGQKSPENYTSTTELLNYEPINQEPELNCNMDNILLEEYKRDALVAEFNDDYDKASDCWNMCLSEIFMNNLELDTNILEKAIACYRKTSNIIREFFTYEDLIKHFPDNPEIENWKKSKIEIETQLPKPPSD